MHLPEPIPAIVHDESFAGVTYHIRGELVPELQVEMGGQAVMFEHHMLLWKETQLNVELKKLPGAVKRKIAGLEFFVTRTSGSGRIAFSRDSPGQCVPMHLRQGEGLDVREHQFLAATDNLDYSFERIKGVQNMLLGGSGFFMDKFRATNGDALVWLHGHGNVFLVNLDRRRAARRGGGRVAVQGPDRQPRGGHDGTEDGDHGRRRQAHVEPLHRPRATGDPDDVHRAAGGRGSLGQRPGGHRRRPRRSADRRAHAGLTPAGARRARRGLGCLWGPAGAGPEGRGRR